MNWLSRTEKLIGKDGVDKLAKAKVAVFGIGGVGSFTAEALGRAGIGQINLIDHDDVDVTNINRQLHALHNTVGQNKVDLMKERLLQINPEIDVKALKEFYTPENGELLLDGHLDYVVDAIDNVTGKLDLMERCTQKDIPIISAMGAGNKLDPTGFKVADILETSVDPLAKVIRKELRKRGINGGIKVVYSKEMPIEPRQFEEDSEVRKKAPGSISFVPSVVGLILAGEVISDLLGINGR